MPLGGPICGVECFHATQKMAGKIKRTLVYDDSERRRLVEQDDIASFAEPVVILGDPGLGKTVLTEALGERPGMRYVHAGTFQRHAEPGRLIDDGERVVIDGLDEIASADPGGSIDAVLRQLSKMDYPPLILSCREADWMGAAYQAKIKEDYRAEPVVLHLQPFSYEDMLAFLSNEFPGIDADGLLEHLDGCGIGSLCKNPLTLQMLGEVMQAEGALPDTRAQLFDRACRVMLEERNPLHESDAHANRTDDELLVAAGAVCSAQLICDRIAVYTGATSKTPEDSLSVADIARLPSGGAAREALRTRLFRAEGEHRFTHIHRAVAEYLGATWLTHCRDGGISQRRISALFGPAHRVSASLRGLYGWIPHFGGPLARHCIETDPYAVLRCGAAETLDRDRARDLLNVLKGLSWMDAGLSARPWERHPASHLMRGELKDDILGILENEAVFNPIGELLIEALPGTDLARKLEPDLVAIAFDCSRYEMARSYARRMLRAIDACFDWDLEIRRLLQREDGASDWVAWETLAGIGADAVSAGTVLDTVMVSLGLDSTRGVERQCFPIRLDTNFLRQVDAAHGEELLDGLMERAAPSIAAAHSSARANIGDLVRFLTALVIGLEPSIRPERVWNWIAWLDGDAAHDNNVGKRLSAAFQENGALRAALLEHVLLGTGADSIEAAGKRLDAARLELYPTADDLAGLMKGLCDPGGGPVDRETWHGLLLLDRSAGGLPVGLRDAAAAAADGDYELLAIVDEMSDGADLKRRAEEEERRSREHAERLRVRQYHRDELAKRGSAIAAGDWEVLALPAEVYLDLPVRPESRHLFEPEASPSGSEVSPEDRLSALLGDEMSGRVLEGFMAVLDRDDLPCASEIVRLDCEGKSITAWLSMICGVAETLRRGLEIARIDRDTLAAVYMALQPLWLFPCVTRLGIGEVLENALFKREADWEAHFRAAIEPRLMKDTERSHELFELTHNRRHADLAGRLSVEWLRSCPALPPSKRAELLVCAAENAGPEMVRELVIDRRADDHPDEETRLFWLSADYVADFDDRQEALGREAADNPGFLWFIRDRIDPPKRVDPNASSAVGLGWNRPSVAQLAFIVEAFGGNWLTSAQHPGGARADGRDAEDAADFIVSAICEISRRPSSEATEALQGFCAAAPRGYVDMAEQSLRRQLLLRRESEYAAPTIEELRAAVTDAPPESIDDMRAWLADRIATLQERIRGSNTDMWEAYWAGACPRDENYCRNRMIEHLSGQLPDSIRLEPEARMPGAKRADIALTRNAIKLPVEIKGQWHRDLWNAVIDQLDAKYAVDWQVDGRGVYIVLWFGDVPDKQLPGHPEGLERPGSPEALRTMLVDRLSEDQRARIDVFVIDLSRPAGTA